jgi:hypothetical protein
MSLISLFAVEKHKSSAFCSVFQLSLQSAFRVLFSSYDEDLTAHYMYYFPTLITAPRISVLLRQTITIQLDIIININIKMLSLGTYGKSERTLFTVSAPSGLPNNFLNY